MLQREQLQFRSTASGVFFHPPEVFEVLRTSVLPELFQRQSDNGPVRVWVPCCGSGSEAYSVAILVLEQLGGVSAFSRLQVFATDTDKEALMAARSGEFSSEQLAEVSSQLLDEYFVRLDVTHYQVEDRLRQSVAFALHNILSDPPFSKIDFILCHDVLSTAPPDVKEQLLQSFHFALREGGCLAVGRDEDVRPCEAWFEPATAHVGVYWTRPRAQSRVDSLWLTDGVVRSTQSNWRRGPLLNYGELARRKLLAECTPAALLIDAAGRVLYSHGSTLPFLDDGKFAAGEPIFSMVREPLRPVLQAAIPLALRRQETLALPPIAIGPNGAGDCVHITIHNVWSMTPLHDPLLLVVFESDGAQSLTSGARRRLRLDDILGFANCREQAELRELSGSNDQLRASNMELNLLNQELEFGNRELETAREELGAVNDELTRVNTQLHEKIVQLETGNADLTTLFNGSDIPTVFLDSDGRIQSFTPATRRLIPITPHDIGRPIENLTARFDDRGLEGEIHDVMTTGASIERLRQATDRRWYILRIIPYRSRKDTSAGVVLTFSDVTELRKQEAAAFRSAILTSTDDAIVGQNTYGLINEWNEGAERTFGFSSSDVVGKTAAFLSAESLRQEASRLTQLALGGVSTRDFVTARIHASGRSIDVSLTVSPIRDESGWIVGTSSIFRDITERKRLEREILEIADRERRRFGQDLHDETGQKLTGLALIAKTLTEQLAKANRPEKDLAERLAMRSQEALAEVRSLARGLLPVEIDANGLMSALEDLARRVSGEHVIQCDFLCDQPVALENNWIATHLCRIAQEAVTNAIKHAGVKCIQVGLEGARDAVILTVRDDGVGGVEQWQPNEGMGLRIMRYRASMMNGALSIENGDDGGAIVQCVVPWNIRQ